MSGSGPELGLYYSDGIVCVGESLSGCAPENGRSFNMEISSGGIKWHDAVTGDMGQIGFGVGVFALDGHSQNATTLDGSGLSIENVATVRNNLRNLKFPPGKVPKTPAQLQAALAQSQAALPQLALTLDGNQPTVLLRDSAGFSTVLGHTNLVDIGKAGEQHSTTAASLVFLGNDPNHHVILQLP